jgi:hypothetical protein
VLPWYVDAVVLILLGDGTVVGELLSEVAGRSAHVSSTLHPPPTMHVCQQRPLAASRAAGVQRIRFRRFAARSKTAGVRVLVAAP